MHIGLESAMRYRLFNLQKGGHVSVYNSYKQGVLFKCIMLKLCLL